MNKSGKGKLQIKDLLIIMAVIVISFVTILIAFQIHFNKVYDKILQKDMEQIEWTSHYVTKLIHNEIENNIESLHASAEMFYHYEQQSMEQWIQNLQEIKEDLDFERMGFIGLNGNSLDDAGNLKKIEDSELLDTIEKGQNYISNLLDDTDQMRIAVPFEKNNEIVGALYGDMSISAISIKIEMDNESHRYFQIIDDNGNYISYSGNIHSFAEDINLWEELKRYQFREGVTIDSIRQVVEAGKSGTFYFSFQEQGRYVTYEPLGINNWYVFSVVVEDYVERGAREIEEIFIGLLVLFIGCIVSVICIINAFIYRTMKTIKIQSREMQVKNSLLSMILKQTNDIPFEIDIRTKQVRIYFHSLEREEIDYKIVEDFSPDVMVEKGVIRREAYSEYKKIYETLTRGEAMEPVVLEMKLEGKWDFNKIHALSIDKDYVIGFFEDYNEQMSQNNTIKEINKKNQTDGLTGLYRREYFVNRVESILKRHSGENGICALFLLDLDHFKEINDTFGHDAGDVVLRDMSHIIRDCVRSTDLAGRLGGDEFVLFIQNVSNPNGVQICAEKLVANLKKQYGDGEKTVLVSASIGVVPVTTEKTFEELYKKADKALYQVKNAHKDGYKILEK